MVGVLYLTPLCSGFNYTRFVLYVRSAHYTMIKIQILETMWEFLKLFMIRMRVLFPHRVQCHKAKIYILYFLVEVAHLKFKGI